MAASSSAAPVAPARGKKRALEFEDSSHASHWLFSHHEVAEADASHSFSEEPMMVFKAKLLYTQYLVGLGRRARVRQRALATAIVYFRRFYYRHSFLDHDPLLIVPTALWVASKVEECSLQAKVLLSHLAHLDMENNYELQHMLDAEFLLIEALRFELVVYQPYLPLQEYLAQPLLGEILGGAASDSFKQTAWFLLNDCFRACSPPSAAWFFARICPAVAREQRTGRSTVPPLAWLVAGTDLVMCHPPHTIALACIHMAGTLLELPTTKWLRRLEVDSQEVEEVTATLIQMYDYCSRMPDREL